MLRRKYLYLPGLMLLMILLSGCSSKQDDQATSGDTAKAIKAKVVYFSIPG